MTSPNYKTLAINRLLRKYYDSKDRAHMRFGQWFVNNYTKSAWPELYYEEDDSKAIAKVNQWLIDHHYFKKLPPIINQPS